MVADTYTVVLSEDDFSGHPNCYNGWSEDYAQKVIKAALNKMKYEGNIENIEFTKYFYRNIEDGNSNSGVCYVETKHAGFYFVMRDMVDHINVVYNRWD